MKARARLQIPRRQQRVVGARWLFGVTLLLVGLADFLAGPRHGIGLLAVAASVLAYNGLLAWRLRLLQGAARPAAVALQLLLDSLATVAAVHYGQPLTHSVQFLFLFPLVVATLLAPREGLFCTAALCCLGYTIAEALTLAGWWPPLRADQGDPALSALVATGLVCAALTAAAAVNNYLVRVLAGIESDLVASETRYRELAGSLEDEVRQRTTDLRQANEALQQRHRELLRQREIDAAIHTSDDLGTVLQRVVDGVADLVGGSQAAIWLADPASGDLRLARYSTSAERRVAAIEALLSCRLDGQPLALPEGSLVARAAAQRQALLTSDLAAALVGHVPFELRPALPAALRILGCEHGVAMPLLVEDALVGILALAARQPLGEWDVERVTAFATQAALALVRVRQERDLLEQAAALEEAYRELERSQEQVVNLEKMRAIAEMTSGVAHNFNNALSAILGTAQLALLEELPQTVTHRLRLIERAAQDAALLVQRIRAFTKEEQPLTAPCDLNELVTDSTAMTEPRWKHHADRLDAPISVDLDLRARLPVEADAAAIREVLINLILNSVNAMPQGGQVRLRTWDDGDHGVVAVRDDGVGMSEETRQRCFEPFYTTASEKGGTGLGLSVAYGIIQRHHGEIRVVSTVGVGTEFTIRLPRAAAVPAVPAVETPAAEPAAAATHVLVVDDQQSVRTTISDMLRALGHSTTIAADGREALQVFDPTRHQVVITDWGMPGMSGLQLARAVKTRSPRTPVVLVTGLDAALPQEVAQSEEVDTRLQKPVDLRDLARVISAVGR
ncbi:MAG: response regulator [Fimbriimonadaceae bacterium]|nr:response regulator [Fimbriimonadaceae bacterium]